LEPVNLKQWNMFQLVNGPGHVEPFLATQSMHLGDVVLLHVGQQDKNYESPDQHTVYVLRKAI
jgi:hypothetical protein